MGYGEGEVAARPCLVSSALAGWIDRREGNAPRLALVAAWRPECHATSPLTSRVTVMRATWLSFW